MPFFHFCKHFFHWFAYRYSRFAFALAVVVLLSHFSQSPVFSETGVANNARSFPGFLNTAVMDEPEIKNPDGKRPLGQVLAQWQKERPIEIIGLEDRMDELVSVSLSANSITTILRDIFRQLGIKNYLIQYDGENPVRILALDGGVEISLKGGDAPSPFAGNEKQDQNRTWQTKADLKENQSGESNSRNTAAAKKDTPKQTTTEYVTVAKVNYVADYSSAEKAGLKAGDLIIRFENIDISSSQQIMSEVTRMFMEDETWAPELTVVRDKKPIKIVLYGGFDGVNLSSSTITKSELDTYLSELSKMEEK